MSNTPLEAADIVVVGLGPAGLLSCLQMGQKGYHVIALDRWPRPYPLPRGVTMDHEVARILAGLGINVDLDPAFEFHDDHYYWLNGGEETLLDIDWFSKADDGWRNTYWFNQPDLEERLRGILASLPNVEIRPGMEVVGLEQDGEGVTVRFREVEAEQGRTRPKEGGVSGEIRARFALGADGANSFLRQSVGYEYVDLEFYHDWVVVDVSPTEMPTYRSPHYQLCDPVRPTSVVPGGPRRRRWEFMVLPGEDPQVMASPEQVWRLLEPYGMNPGNAHLDRAVAWRFQGKYLERWRAGRVLLMGDAAHLMPPFMGEGMCAALRDVNNLAWRLDLVLKGLAAFPLLDEWSDERREHVKYYINFSIELGRVICVTDAQEAAERDARMKAEHAERAKIGPIQPHRAVLGQGTWNGNDPLAGRPSIQGEVAYLGRTGRFDDVVGRGWCLLSRVEAGSPLTESQQESFRRIGGQVLTMGSRGSGAQVIDLGGTYAGWMAKHGVSHLLVRPDAFVAATADSGYQLRAVFDQLMTKITAE
nr:bifunctional 3-(3-hydroxy-phenyl)propionate/3-hydroxycinnamic acid hydroxylase [uncultured Holophaga sp.]